MGSIISTSHRHFLHLNVLLRHAYDLSGEAESDIETILTEAATGRRRIWTSSIVFAELRPSAFVAGRFAALPDLIRYLRSIATFVAPDPNTMLRAARLRDVRWQRAAALRGPGEQPRFLSLLDAVQLASALWVKETAGVADLEFLAFEDFGGNSSGDAGWLSLLRLQDYADDLPVDSDGLAAVRLPRSEPVLRSGATRRSAPVG